MLACWHSYAASFAGDIGGTGAHAEQSMSAPASTPRVGIETTKSREKLIGIRLSPTEGLKTSAAFKLSIRLMDRAEIVAAV
jgi:hypothetical protein